jgi:hypothetical protein
MYNQGYAGMNMSRGYQQGYGGFQSVPFRNAAPYNPQYGPQNYNGQPMRKKSGAKSKRYTVTQGVNAGAQRVCTSGWNVKRNGGFTSFLCNTTNKSQDVGKGWVGSVACEVVNKSTGQKSFYWGMMQIATGKVVISDLGVVLNPKAPNGGYCGTFSKKNRR